jgi:hypothetical protein
MVQLPISEVQFVLKTVLGAASKIELIAAPT